MRLPPAIVTLAQVLAPVLALALAGCGMLGEAPEDAGEPAAAASGGDAPPAPDSAAAPATAAALPTETPAPAAPTGNGGGGTAQIAAVPSVTAPPAPPASTAPASTTACADVTAAGPAREIDLDAVRQLLRGVDYRRGSLETNAAYRNRVITHLDSVATLATERTGRPALVFSLPIPAYRLNYDAERQTLWVGSDLGLLPGGSAIGMGDFILVKSTERQIGRHQSTIAYGARRGPGVEREVTRIAGDQLGISVAGGSSLGWPTSFERLRIPMAPAEGQQARQSLAVLFVAHLQEPYFVTGEFIQEAKIDDLVEKRLTVEAIRIAIDCAAVYDRHTGRVIRQLVPPGPPRV